MIHVFSENGSEGRDAFLIRSMTGRKCKDKKEDWFTKYDKTALQMENGELPQGNFMFALSYEY